MKAVILAGGKGRRLRPFSVVFPKPLAPIGDHPVLEHLIRFLMRHGITDVVLCVDYLAELLRAFLDSRTEALPNVSISYVRDLRPGGTAGPLAGIEGLTSTFLVTNGDLVTDLDVPAMIERHRSSGAMLTIATYSRKTQLPYGLVHVDAGGFVRGYDEKPILSNEVSMGISLHEPGVLRYVTRGSYLDFPDLVQRLIDAGERVATFHWDGYWVDIGNPDDYAQAQNDYAERLGPWSRSAGASAPGGTEDGGAGDGMGPERS